MESLSQNKPLRLSLTAMFALLLLLSSEIMPDLNELFELAKLPSDDFRFQLQLLIISDVAGTYILSRVLNWIFSMRLFS